jgi:hypothetical protein
MLQKAAAAAAQETPEHQILILKGKPTAAVLQNLRALLSQKSLSSMCLWVCPATAPCSPLPWIEGFIRLGGISEIFNFLNRCMEERADSQIVSQALSCVRVSHFLLLLV